MRVRRPIFFFLLLAALALVVVGCGGGGNESTTTAAGGTGTTAGTTETTGGAAVDLSGQSLEVVALWTGPEQKSGQQVLDAFAKQTGATVKYTAASDDIAAVLGTRIQGGQPPDIAFVAQPGLVKQFAQNNQLQPLDDVIGKEVDQNFNPVWRELGTVDGKLYGLIFKAANKSTFWYNKAALEDAGVQPPKTWDELLTAADTLQQSGLAPFSIGGADGWVLTDWFEQVYLRTAGPEKYDQLTNHEIPWTDESVKTALTLLQKVWGKSGNITGGATSALQKTFEQSVQQTFSDPPKAAMVYEGDFVATEITNGTKAKLGTDADFFDFPSINNSPPAVIVAGDTAMLMKDSEAGKAFMKFLTTPEAAKIWAKLGGFSSPNKAVTEADYPNEIVGRAATAVAKAERARFDMSDLTPPAFGGTPSKGEWKVLQNFLRNPQDINGTMQTLEAEAKAAYK